MAWRIRFRWVLVALSFTAGASMGCCSLSHVHRAEENLYGLQMAVLKPLGSATYYVGSDGDFSYFRQGTDFPCERYKARTSELRLLQTFSLGQGEPYQVTVEMVR